MSAFRIEGFAIVSDDDCIAAADGSMPASLKHEADWRYFQEHLARAAIVVTGRLGHEAHPNPPGRRRLVFTSGVKAFEKGNGVWFFNPAGGVTFAAAAAEIAQQGGNIAVTGGTAVFGWFLNQSRFDAFHLSRAIGARIPQGRKLFPGRAGAEAQLAGHGLEPGQPVRLSMAPQVDVTVFRRPK